VDSGCFVWEISVDVFSIAGVVVGSWFWQLLSSIKKITARIKLRIIEDWLFIAGIE
jgi:hypothetical protein